MSLSPAFPALVRRCVLATALASAAAVGAGRPAGASGSPAPADATSAAATSAVATSAVATDPALVAPRPELVEGRWESHELNFVYLGQTARYSCEALADKLEVLLETAGARAGADARPTGCDDPLQSFGRFGRFSSVRLRFQALAPAPPAAEPAPAPPAIPEKRLGRDVPPLKRADAPEPGVGAWRRVEIVARSPRRIDDGDCELVEQFAREVLPKFSTRALEERIRCVPYSVRGSDVQLSFEVLAGLPDADAAKAATRR